MKFKPTHKTGDNAFEVEIDANKGIELYLGLTHKITVYNTQTKQLSEKTLHKNKKGILFNGNTSYWNKTKKSRYYLHELEDLSE